MTEIEKLLHAAGFAGVEREGQTVFARDGAEAPEFTVEAAGGWRFALRFPVRATEGEREAWMRANPAGRLDIEAGETRLVMVLPEGADVAAGLEVWRGLARVASQAAVVWRRRQKPVHGM